MNAPVKTLDNLPQLPPGGTYQVSELIHSLQLSLRIAAALASESAPSNPGAASKFAESLLHVTHALKVVRD